MTHVDRDEERENRIAMKIIVDIYEAEEQALGWYYYLENMLHFPFAATCISQRATSPLAPSDAVKVIGQPAEAECEHEMMVDIQWKKRRLTVPLAQLQYDGGDEETRQAIADWHYWVNRGYTL